MTGRMLSSRGPVRLAVVVTVAAAGLAACTLKATEGPRRSLIGISRSESGGPAVEVRHCAGSRTQFIAVKPQSSSTVEPSQGDFSRYLWFIRNDTDKRTGYTVEFGAVPAGWRGERSGPVALAPAVDYFLNVYGAPQPSVTVTFTEDAVDALEPDQVLTVGRNDLTSVVMSRADFEADARRRC